MKAPRSGIPAAVASPVTNPVMSWHEPERARRRAGMSPVTSRVTSRVTSPAASRYEPGGTGDCTNDRWEIH